MPGDFWDHYQYLVGCDPSFGRTGLVVLDRFGIMWARGYRSGDGSLEERMTRVAVAVVGKAFALSGVGKNRVVFAIEENHVTGGRSAQSALKQRELIGVIAAKAWEQGFQVIRVAPTSGKKALTGNGRADKDDMVEALADYDGAPVGLCKADTEAVADALGAALAGRNKAETELL